MPTYGPHGKTIDQEAIRLRRVLVMALELRRWPRRRAELAVMLGVSERQITNDLWLLRVAGICIDHDRQIGYRARF